MLDHPAFLSWRGRTGCHTSVSPRGTEGSNPSPSSEESIANLFEPEDVGSQYEAIIESLSSESARILMLAMLAIACTPLWRDGCMHGSNRPT